MGLSESISTMNELMSGMCKDLVKAQKGNWAAAQRVRTASVRFAKVAKDFRKESVYIGGKVRKVKKGAKKKRSNS